MSLGVTTLLAMSTTQASINKKLPPVAYYKAIDVWSGVCVSYVFCAMLEYALVNYASRYSEKVKRNPFTWKRHCFKKFQKFILCLFFSKIQHMPSLCELTEASKSETYYSIFSTGFSFIIKMTQSRNGLCFYSNVPWM